MDEVNGFVLLSSVLEPGLIGYALRLNRAFGTRHVGWWVFWAFLSLALLHLLHLFQPGVGPTGLIDVFICLLLLVGMLHTESSCTGRVRVESKEQKLSAELERVRSQAAELGSANENLLRQLLVREQREQALKSSAQQLSVLFFENPLPMWVFELSSLRLLTANEAALRYYGYSASEFMARTARDLCPAEDAPAFVADWTQATLVPSASRLCRQLSKEGNIFEVEVRAQDLPYDGHPARLIVAQDVGRRPPSEVPRPQQSLNTQLLELNALIETAMKTLGA